MKETYKKTVAGRDRLLAGLLILVLNTPMVLGADDQLGVPTQPMFSATRPQGWSAGVHYNKDSRELKGAGEILELDGDRVVAELGYEVAPFLQLAVQAGWIKAELGGQEGENGLSWAGIARANLAEYVLAESPEVGRKQWLGAALDVLYRSSESNQDEADLQWGETLIVPSVYFFHNRRGDALRKHYHASGFGLHGGIAFSFVDGEYGSLDLEENRNFGFMLGIDARWTSSWVARLRGTVYGSGDQFIEIGTQFQF